MGLLSMIVVNLGNCDVLVLCLCIILRFVATIVIHSEAYWCCAALLS